MTANIPPRLPGASKPPAQAPIQPQQLQRPSSNLRRAPSASSESSTSSQVTDMSSSKPLPYSHYGASAAASMTNLHTTGLRKPSNDPQLRGPSPAMTNVSQAAADYHRHKARQHSQGFFEPTLPSQNNPQSPVNYSASQIAAQAAMHVNNSQHGRGRSQSIPEPAGPGSRKGSGNGPTTTTPTEAPRNLSGKPNPPPFQDGTRSVASTAAASAAYPRSPLQSPELPYIDRAATPTGERETKPGKEKSRMKIFSKPKSINTSKDSDKKSVTLQSPSKTSIYSTTSVPNRANQSTTSLVDPIVSGASSFYSNANGSSSTLIPSDKGTTGEKDKHRHHFLQRQKAKFKDAAEQRNLQLSSASSNSRPADPNAPHPLYSFAPSSPGMATFNKSMTGLDLRHGGRALREKKREEKAAAQQVPPLPTGAVPREGVSTPVEWNGPASAGTPPASGTPGGGNPYFHLGDTGPPSSQGLTGYGLTGMTPDDAWPFLKARLLNVFEGVELTTPIEDFNRLVTVHLQRCIQIRAPGVILEDLRELLQTGFLSLDQTLRRTGDDRLVPSLVEMWSNVFGTILPFMQAVFLPLDLELKGRGTLMSSRDAADFWGALPQLSKVTSTGSTTIASRPLGEALDVRSLVLLTFRDTVILPRHDALLSIFSRLSLDNIHAPPVDPVTSPLHHLPPRPGTASSSSGAADPSSFNSQGSTLLDSSTAGSLGVRSRATSNTSAGSFHSVSSQRPHPPQQPQPQPPPQHPPRGQSLAHGSAKVTDTAARMLQCISVLAGLQAPGAAAEGSVEAESEDAETAARRKMERLARELKLNWLARGRTGRNRKGFIGGKVKGVQQGIGLGVGIGVAA